MSVTEDDFAALEIKLGARLPPLLKGALRKRNGFWVECEGTSWRVLPVQSGTSQQDLSRSAADITHETRSAREFHRLPEGWVAIANAADARLWWVIRVENGALTNDVCEWERERGEPTPVGHLGDLLISKH